jgi:hypothetical protein
MPYVINNSSGTKLFYVGDQSFNTETALSLPGRNVPDYGEVIDTNFIHLLENFANGTPPQTTSTLTGQLWYDTTNGSFKVYDGNKWVQHNKIPVSEGAPGGTDTEGTMYYDETIRKLKVFYDSSWIDSSYAGEISQAYNTIGQGSPSLYGTRVRNIFLKRLSDDRDVPVLAIVHSYNGLTGIDIPVGTVNTAYGSETLIGILSRVPTFIVKDVSTNSEEENLNWYDELSEAGGIGIEIRPGLNVRRDVTAEYPISTLAQRAKTSYNLNLGSVGADGANIEAANVFRHDVDSLPANTLTYDLGSASNVFAELWVNDIWLSNSLVTNGNANISIGTDDNPIENIYVTNMEIDGNLVIEGNDVSIGTVNSPVDSIYANSAYVYQSISVGNIVAGTNFVLPDSRAGNKRLVCDDNGQTYWIDNGGLYTNISVEKGLNFEQDSSDIFSPAENINNRQATISLRLGNGLNFDSAGNLQINQDDLTSDNIQEGSTNLYYTPQRVYDFLTSATAESRDTGLETQYDSSTGNSKLRLHGGAPRVVGTIIPSLGSPLTVIQERTNNNDEFGYNQVEIDIKLGTLESRDESGANVVTSAGIINTTGELELDWPVVAENLYTTDLTRASGIEAVALGEIGIARVDLPDVSSSPATHLIYLKSLNNLGGGESKVSDILFKNKNNEMTVGTGKISFGASTDYNLTLGYDSAGARPHNSTGSLMHLGDVHLMNENASRPGSLMADGDVTAYKISQNSDKRLKKNISTINHGLEKVNALRGVNYKLLRDNTTHVGLIAQEVEEIIPEVVSDDSTGMKSVNYGALVGVLIEAVKDLSKEIEILKAKLGD